MEILRNISKKNLVQKRACVTRTILSLRHFKNRRLQLSHFVYFTYTLIFLQLEKASGNVGVDWSLFESELMEEDLDELDDENQ
jgi:hypothetical protein